MEGINAKIKNIMGTAIGAWSTKDIEVINIVKMIQMINRINRRGFYKLEIKFH